MSTWTECLATLLMQSVFALKTLRAHGLNRECLHNVFNAVILAKLTNGVSAWIGFIRAAEIERIEAFIRRCKLSELCSAEAKTAEICEVHDNQLFSNIIRNLCHILNQLLPSFSEATENCNLRPRKHNRLLPERATRLFDANFIYRIFYCDISDCAVTTIFTISLLRLRSVNLLFNKRLRVTKFSCSFISSAFLQCLIVFG